METMTTVSNGSDVLYEVSGESALQMKTLRSYSLKFLVNDVNALGIQRGNIVTLMKENDAFVLVYYGK